MPRKPAGEPPEPKEPGGKLGQLRAAMKLLTEKLQKYRAAGGGEDSPELQELLQACDEALRIDTRTDFEKWQEIQRLMDGRPEQSNNWIATTARVSFSTVEKVRNHRNEQEAAKRRGASDGNPAPGTVARKAKDGRYMPAHIDYPMNLGGKEAGPKERKRRGRAG